jgi:hypothetical protein
MEVSQTNTSCGMNRSVSRHIIIHPVNGYTEDLKSEGTKKKPLKRDTDKQVKNVRGKVMR